MHHLFRSKGAPKLDYCLTVISVLLFPYISNAQTLVVLDSISREPLIYARVQTENTLTYTDSAGRFDVSSFVNSCIDIGCTGYNTLHLCSLDSRSTSTPILLSPIITTLPTAIVRPHDIMRIDFLKPNRKSYPYMPLPGISSIRNLIIPKKGIIGKRIEEVSFRCMNIPKLATPSGPAKFCDWAVLRLNILDRNRHVLYSSEAQRFEKEEYSNLSFQVSPSDISIPKEGLYIELEIIDLADHELPTIYVELTHKKSSYFTALSEMTAVLGGTLRNVEFNKKIHKGDYANMALSLIKD